jgi:hypothetical protein
MPPSSPKKGLSFVLSLGHACFGLGLKHDQRVPSVILLEECSGLI